MFEFESFLYAASDIEELDDLMDNHSSHICSFSTGWQLIFKLPISFSDLRQLLPAELLELKFYIEDVFLLYNWFEAPDHFEAYMCLDDIDELLDMCGITADFTEVPRYLEFISRSDGLLSDSSSSDRYFSAQELPELEPEPKDAHHMYRLNCINDGEPSNRPERATNEARSDSPQRHSSIHEKGNDKLETLPSDVKDYLLKLPRAISSNYFDGKSFVQNCPVAGVCAFALITYVPLPQHLRGMRFEWKGKDLFHSIIPAPVLDFFAGLKTKEQAAVAHGDLYLLLTSRGYVLARQDKLSTDSPSCHTPRQEHIPMVTQAPGHDDWRLRLWLDLLAGLADNEYELYKRGKLWFEEHFDVDEQAGSSEVGRFVGYKIVYDPDTIDAHPLHTDRNRGARAVTGSKPKPSSDVPGDVMMRPLPAKQKRIPPSKSKQLESTPDELLENLKSIGLEGDVLAEKYHEISQRVHESRELKEQAKSQGPGKEVGTSSAASKEPNSADYRQPEVDPASHVKPSGGPSCKPKSRAVDYTGPSRKRPLSPKSPQFKH